MSKFLTSQNRLEADSDSVKPALRELLEEVEAASTHWNIDSWNLSSISGKPDNRSGWLVVARWTAGPQADQVGEVDEETTDQAVSFHGGSTLLSALAKLEVDLRECRVKLYPDRYAQKKSQTLGRRGVNGKVKT